MPVPLALPDLRHAGLSDVGQVRDVNEDACAAEAMDGGHLFVVADGMGGHQSGDVASRVAVHTVVDAFRSGHAIDLSQRLADALTAAHQAIVARQGMRQGRERMGTTAVALFVTPGQAHYAWVGDSRIYLVRDGELSAITRDHTLGRELLERGYQDVAQIQSNPERDKLARALGMKDQWRPETCAALPLEPGDMFLLCSDGLYRKVPETDILAILLGLEPVEAAIQLIQMANDGGGEDNITVQVVHVDSREAAIEAAAQGGHVGSLTTELMALSEADVGELPARSTPATQQLGPSPDSAPTLPGVPPPVPDPLSAPEDPTPVSLPVVPMPVAPPRPPPRPPPQPAPQPVSRPVSRPPPAAITLRAEPHGADTLPPSAAFPPVSNSTADTAEGPVVAGEDGIDTLPPEGAETQIEAVPAAPAEKADEAEPVTPPAGPSISISRTLLIVGALLLFLAAFAGGIIVTVAVVLVVSNRESADPAAEPVVESLPEPASLPDATVTSAGAILALPEDEECERQWSLLRDSHGEIAADPDQHGTVAERIFRCFDTQAYRAVETFRAHPSDVTLRDAERAVRSARRFLEPPLRADGKLRDTAAVVSTRLGADEVRSRLTDMDEWQAALHREER
jgi:protein phosphatase